MKLLARPAIVLLVSMMGCAAFQSPQQQVARTTPLSPGSRTASFPKISKTVPSSPLFQKTLQLPAKRNDEDLVGNDNEGVGEPRRPSFRRRFAELGVEDAVDITRGIQLHQGAGHSVGIHTMRNERPLVLAQAIPTSRVIVNQAHTFATGGSFTNGMPFSLSMGCGSWGGNSIDTNLHWRHFMQTTKIVREIPASEPTLEDIFSGYWEEAGK